MAMAPLKVKAALTTVVLLLLLAASTLVVSAEEEAPPPSSAVYHFKLIHAADGDSSRPEEALSSVPAAAASTTGTTDGDTTTTYSSRATYEGGEYLMEVGIGAPDKKFKAVADTGSDVTWTQQDKCDPAKRRKCLKGRPQQDCEFRKVYGSSKLGATGFMAVEKLFFFPSSSSSSSSSKGAGGEAPPVSVRVALGCAEKCHDDKGGDMDCHHRLIPEGADGVIGLNRGPMSLLRKLKATRLSYCLQRDRMSPLWIGGAKLSLAASAADVQTTPLVGHERTDFGSVWANRYYVKLEGVSVTTATTTTAAAAAPPVSIPGEAFNHRSNDVEGKKGVMFVDSGCTYSHLETAAYNEVKNQLTEQLKKVKSFPGSNDNKPWECLEVPYDDSAANSIHVNLHLAKDGDAGATMSLGWRNYMKPGDETRTTSCLAIKDSGQSISVLGNFQQQKIHMLFDLDDEKLFFVPVQDCSASNIKLID